jgi:hypothetical protein
MTQLYNLDNYEDHYQYYELYTKNNSKLNDIIQNNIINKYQFENDHKKYYRLQDNIIMRNIFEVSGIIIMLNAIIEKNLYGYCIKTGNKYKCEKMYFTHNNLAEGAKYLFYAYHFNCSENEFIIMFSWEYFSPHLIYYPKTNEAYNISYRHSGIKDATNALIHGINSNRPHYPIDNHVSYAIGIMPNAGHYFWQEIYGLMILIENNLLDNIDEFIIYNYDYLDIGNVLKNKFNKPIKYLNSDSDNHSVTLNLSKHYITNSLTETFKNIYDLNYTKNTTDLNILFDIRSSNRLWLNQHSSILNIMNNVKHTFSNYSINFYISGFYTYQHNIINPYYDKNREINTQNGMVDKLQSEVPFHINNLINVNLSEIMKILPTIDLCIANVGSGASFFAQTALNKPTIAFTQNSCCVAFDSQRYAFENNVNNCTFIDSTHITDVEGNFILNEEFLLSQVMLKLKEITNI